MLVSFYFKKSFANVTDPSEAQFDFVFISVFDFSSDLPVDQNKQQYGLFSNVTCIFSFHLSNQREIVPRMSDKLCKSLLNS